jgi:hypothetical protein
MWSGLNIINKLSVFFRAINSSMVDEREAYLSIVKSNCSGNLTVTGNKKEGGKNEAQEKIIFRSGFTGSGI